MLKIKHTLQPREKTGFVKQGIIATTTYENLRGLINSETRTDGKIKKHKVAIVIRPSEKVTGIELERRIKQYMGAAKLRHMPNYSKLVPDENIFYDTPVIVHIKYKKDVYRRVELRKETFGKHYDKIRMLIKEKSKQRSKNPRWNLTAKQVKEIKRADTHIRDNTKKGFFTPSKLWSIYQSTFRKGIDAKTLGDYKTQVNEVRELAISFNQWHSNDNKLVQQLERIVKSEHEFNPNNIEKIDSGDELYEAFMKIAELDGMKNIKTVQTTVPVQPPQPSTRPTKDSEIVWNGNEIFDSSKYNPKFKSLHQILAVGARADMRKGRERVRKLHTAWTEGSNPLFNIEEVVGRKNRRNVDKVVRNVLTDGITLGEYKRIKAGLEELETINWSTELNESQKTVYNQMLIDDLKKKVPSNKKTLEANIASTLNLSQSDLWKMEKASFLEAMNNTRDEINRSHGRYGRESSLRWLDQRFNPINIAKGIGKDIGSGKPLRILKAVADMYTFGFRPIKGEVGSKIFKWYNAGRAGTAAVELGEAIRDGKPGTAAANIADLLRMRGKKKSDHPVPTRGLEGNHRQPTQPFRRR